jgi:hypothetical protein
MKVADFSKNNNDQQVITGENIEKFLKDIGDEMSNEEKNNLKNSSIEILKNCVPSKQNSFESEQNTGLVLGYVQSGKTRSFMSLIALAKDNGYKLVIVLGGTTNILLDQTTDRLYEKLDDENFFIFEDFHDTSEYDKLIGIINNSKRKRTVVIPVLKNHSPLKKMIKFFRIGELQKTLDSLGVLIIDDEADQASLNGWARRNFNLSNKNIENEIDDEDEKSDFKFTTTYKTLIKLKECFSNHTYIQYTATPQANILQSQRDLLRPSWCEVLNPGKNYTGGQRFFNQKKDLLVEIDKEIFKDVENPEMPEKLKNAFNFFIVKSALLHYTFKDSKRNRKSLEKTSMMVHADRLVDVNSYYFKWLKSYSNNLKKDLNSNEYEIIHEYRSIYKICKEELSEFFDIFPTFEETLEKIKYWVFDNLKFWFVAGNGEDQKKSFKENWKKGKHHVLVGGQKLDRGFTVKDLIVTYLPRTTKSQSNADTIEQRCRFFGYKKEYIESCKVYLPEESIEEFEEYVNFEEKLRKLLSNYPIDEFYNDGRLMEFNILSATSKNKIPAEIIKNNFRTYDYFQPDFINFEFNNEKIEFFIKNSNQLGVLESLTDSTKDKSHMLYETGKNLFINLLNSMRFFSYKDKLTKDQIVNTLDALDNEKMWLINMAYQNKSGRGRTLYNDGRIKQLFSNYPVNFGDRKLLLEKHASGKFDGLFKNEPIVQIHKIKILDNENYSENLKKHLGKVLYIIAFVMPGNKRGTLSFNY